VADVPWPDSRARLVQRQRPRQTHERHGLTGELDPAIHEIPAGLCRSGSPTGKGTAGMTDPVPGAGTIQVTTPNDVPWTRRSRAASTRGTAAASLVGPTGIYSDLARQRNWGRRVATIRNTIWRSRLCPNGAAWTSSPLSRRHREDCREVNASGILHLPTGSCQTWRTPPNLTTV
jgi:hypothetical protein